MLVRIAWVVATVFLGGCSAAPREAARAAQAGGMAAQSRTFTVHYIAEVPAAAPNSRRVDVWLPVPRSDAQQRICDLSVKTDLPHVLETDCGYGNTLLHVWSDRPGAAQVELVFCCTRLEEHALPGEPGVNIARDPPPGERDLRPDRLGVIDETIRQTARRLVRGKRDPVARARAIYDYVVSHMIYDKSVPGWGRGDTARACQVGKGNCTDFHALFISLARAAGIPSRFGIGFPLPTDRRAGKLEGYHCWAEFWVDGMGWVPVDCSEAWKHPDRREFYFGNLDADRFRLSVGRDIQLPGMRGAPLNYFLNPYAESDGKPALGVQREITFVAAAS
jgi:transglutaminase-like putative cysteine protease